MPLAVPNRLADPATLEALATPPTQLIQAGGLFIPYYNKSLTNAIMAGEPVVFGDRVGIAERTIMPASMGTLLLEWIVEAVLPSNWATNIAQGALVYWNTTLDPGITLVEGGASGFTGAATGTQPNSTQGFILGRAVLEFKKQSSQVSKDGGTPPDARAAIASSKFVRVVSLAGATTVY